MTRENTEFALIIYGSDLQSHLARQADSKPFEWCGAEREKQAEEHFEAVKAAASLAANIKQGGQTRITLEELRNQAELQSFEIAKLTLEDFLKRYRMSVTFGSALSGGRPLNTSEFLMTPRVFELIEVLEEYPYPQAFGREGLNLNSMRIAERKGGCVLELRFFGELCTVSC